MVLVAAEERWLSPLAPEYRHLDICIAPVPMRLAADRAGCWCEPRCPKAHYWSLVGATMRFAGDERQSAHFVGYLDDAAKKLFHLPLHRVEIAGGRDHILRILALAPQLFKGQKVNPVAMGARVGRRPQYGGD